MNNLKHETVADIVKKKRDTANEAELKGKNTFAFDLAKMLREEADRIEAAHQREVAELRECLREAVTEVCNRLEKCGFKEPCVFKTCYVQKWRKALKGSSND